MKNHNQLFFPCLESPLRLYLSVATGTATATEEKAEDETIVKEIEELTEDELNDDTSDRDITNLKTLPPSSTTAANTAAQSKGKSNWKDQKHQYLSLQSLNKKKVCVSDTPHEWCLLWNTPATAAAVLDEKNNSFPEDHHYHQQHGVRDASFVLQSVDKKVFLTCDGEGNLSTCTKEYLDAKRQQQWEQEQQEHLSFQEESGSDSLEKLQHIAGGEDQGSFTWALDYEDASGTVVTLVNTTYQRKLAVLNPSDDTANDSSYNRNRDKPICTTLPAMTKTLAEDEEDAHLFPGATTSTTTISPASPIFASQWKMRFRSGELLFLSNPTIQRRLRCDAFGGVTLDENRKGWEVLRFVEAGYGGYVQIVSWTHDSYLLYSNQYGQVGMTQHVESPNTLWAISRYCDVDGNQGGVLLRSVRHNRYLSALSETELATVKEQTFSFAAVQWELEAANQSTFFLTTSTTAVTAAAAASDSDTATHNYHFLSSRANGKVFSAKRGKDWEEWKLEPVQQDDNSLDEDSKPPAFDSASQVNIFSIYSNKHEKYLGSTEDGNVYTTESLGEAEYWELEESSSGDGYIIISHLYCDRQLYCSDIGDLQTSPTECQAWNLQPRMPSSISKSQMAVAGVAAATLLVASPLSLALGAAARAPLAAMMVGGAEVAATEAVVAYGVGTAVLGTSAVAILADHKHRYESKKSQQNEHPIQSVNRPLVAWRSW